MTTRRREYFFGGERRVEERKRRRRRRKGRRHVSRRLFLFLQKKAVAGLLRSSLEPIAGPLSVFLDVPDAPEQKKGTKGAVGVSSALSLSRTTTTTTTFFFFYRSYLFPIPPFSQFFFPKKTDSQLRGHRIYQRAPWKRGVLRRSAGRRPRNQRREFFLFRRLAAAEKRSSTTPTTRTRNSTSEPPTTNTQQPPNQRTAPPRRPLRGRAPSGLRVGPGDAHAPGRPRLPR